ncbi:MULTISPECIES: M48 family metalloprotease [unclassified Neptuniibacter]|uniref:M48 family metalloprotease n=1 Tax=unclassified Neptuniibacter TaxID=2630693 RepID=UPI000C4F469F|nr:MULTISPECIES: M48 family metalloprotease [unclassified Neptuniibacter]MAY42096.1 peptidase M48 [Oceanospirillaceae bacterium]|tara:strand:- start:12275 stop:13711 length:1437 start_codon:yes stop_codon:yes gene_type:complete
MRNLCQFLLFSVILYMQPISLHADSQLPSIGSSGYSVISPQQEYQLGRAWVRVLRGSTRLYDDAVVSQYVEDLTWSLVTHSQLSDRRIEVVVLDNPTVNAFAAPGGIVGVHTGLLITALNEAQLASVLSHELAHLSQRHFAAQLEEQRRNQPLFIASLLGSILLAAVDTEAGIAAMQGSMAASTSSRLSFSRQNEREADYIGMQTLIQAGYSPTEMAEMFAQLQKAARFSRVPPEFLLTHPVTQARISDSLNRAQNFKGMAQKENTISFDIAKIRIQVNYAKDLKKLLANYISHLEKYANDSTYYAVAYAAIKNKKFEIARQHMNKFTKAFKTKLSARLLEAEYYIAKEELNKADKVLSTLMSVYPGSHAVSFIYAKNLLLLNRPDKASRVYQDLVKNNPNDSRAWYLLAESYGLEGNIVGVHEARIEYFLLTANIDTALRQIEYALKEPGLTNNERARIEQRKEDAKTIRQSLEFDL